MRLSKIITNKTVAVLAILVGLLELGPGVTLKGLAIKSAVEAILWFLGGVFTWQKKVWASLLLGALASYFLIKDVLLQIPRFGDIFVVSPSDAEVFGIYAPAITIFCIFLETIIMLCFIYHAVFSMRQGWRP